MKVSIRRTVVSEAERLAQIQREAFRPLYEAFHDAGNPFLRGEEDILRRLNKHNRYFTILLGEEVVGGIFYRLPGERTANKELGAGEYYLARVYVCPEYQNQGIARQAILLCEKEFPDAKYYYVDFPEALEKNRKCYQRVGYCDTGERIEVEGAPTLALFRKEVRAPFEPSDVSFPMIYEVETWELQECLDVIHQSFRTVAEQFGLTQENCPKHTSFLPLEQLENQKHWGWRMFALYAGKKIIGYLSLSEETSGVFELHNLAVLPEYRHRNFGRMLLDFAKETVRALDGSRIKIGIIEESDMLKKWYIANGFVPVGTKKFAHLPFTSGYLEWKNERKE